MREICKTKMLYDDLSQQIEHLEYQWIIEDNLQCNFIKVWYLISTKSFEITIYIYVYKKKTLKKNPAERW